MWISDAVASLLGLFYPAHCESCGNPLRGTERVLCLLCRLRLPHTYFQNLKHQPALDRFLGSHDVKHAVSFLYFSEKGMLQLLLHSFKYQGKKMIGFELGSMFGRALHDQLWMKEVDLIVPVPLHYKKQYKRGYNQSVIIAEGMREALLIPIAAKGLKRIINTASQTQMSRKQRIENVRGAFTVTDPAIFKNKNILLVDDVLTTGATLASCAAVLAPYVNTIAVATLAIATD